MSDNKIKFKPIWGSSSTINEQAKKAGQLFFETDTKKIRLDIDDENRLLFGGSSSGASLFYSSQGAAGDEISEIEDEGYSGLYLLYANQLEITPESQVKIDDLIIGADGAFYRIEQINSEGDYVCSRMAISGSGGGGGEVKKDDIGLSIDSATLSPGTTLIQGQDYYVSVTPTNLIENGNADTTNTLLFTFTGANGYSTSRTVPTTKTGEPYRLNLNFLPVNENITMKVTATSPNSWMTDGVSKRVTNISVVTMAIKKSNTLNTASIQTGSATLLYSLVGSSTIDETLHVAIDGIEDESLQQSVRVTSSEKSLNISKLSHGTHEIELWVSTEINGVTVSSDSIVYEIAFVDEQENLPVIWVNEYPKTVIQYENFSVEYQVYDPSASGNGNDDYAEISIWKNGSLYSQITRKYVPGSWLILDLTESYEVGDNTFEIHCGDASKTIEFNVTTEGSRDLGIVHQDALILNLSATGRSNDEISANRPVWTYENYYTNFNGFNWYNNGWKNDNDGFGSYLSITNGSSITIPFKDMSKNPIEDFTFNNNTTNYTIELRFRIKNVQEYSTLVTTIPYYYVLDENGVKSSEGVSINDIKEQGLVVATDDDGNWLMDEKNSQKIIKNEEGVCLRYLGTNPAYGLCIGTQEAYFRSPEGVTSVRYKEDEIINFSVVVSTTEKLASIYLNGILSGSLNLGADSAFNAGSVIEINSNYCDIDIYKIRAYRYGLTMPEVIHNYIADIHDITLYDQNQLTKDDDPTLLSYTKLVNYNKAQLEAENYDALTMPYAVIETIDNVAGAIDPNKGTHPVTDDRLPWKKGNNRYCKITFVNPALDAAYNTGKIDINTYISHSPSYECVGADINVQGTSSQGYPRRNYKTKMKSATGQKDAAKVKHSDWGWFYTNEKFIEDSGKTSFKKWQQDSPKYGTNKFTWKIDYMESSGSYNTGFANLIGNNIYNQHPLDYYNIPGVDTTGMRTTVYGFPVLVFHKHNKPADLEKMGTPLEDEVYEYIGRYNINLDKSSNELYGFETEVEQPYVNEEWDEKLDDGTVVHHMHPYIAQVAECWELTDNQGTWTSFSYPSSAQESHFSTYTPDSYDINTGELLENPKLEVIKHFEARYNYYGDQIEIIADDEKPYDIARAIEEGFEEINTIPKMNNYIIEKWGNLEKLVNWLDSTDRSKANPERDITPIEYQYSGTLPDLTGVTTREVNGVKYATFTKDTATYRLQKFKSEFTKHFNLEYCAVYFIMTELLLCYDSRGKNMMLASFGPMEVGGDYIWFPIFYDIDTQLGLNNIGATLWDYDTDATLEQTFSTPSSVLWVNFLAAFEDNIKSKYAALRSDSKITYENVNGAYLCDPSVFDSYAMRGLRPIIAIGLDEYYKYVAPSKTGYYNTSGELKYDNNSYAYAVNGDRILSRELLLRNRLNYMDSYWMAGSYTSAEAIQTGIRMRANANNSDTSDKYLDSNLLDVLPANAGSRQLAPYPVAHYDATPEFTITPFLSQYVFTFNDKTPSGNSVKYQGTPVQTTVSDSVSDGYRRTPQFPEQIIYVPGADYLSSMGDLSLKYLSQLTIPAGKRLLDLDVGSDAPDYFNNLLGVGTGQFNINDSANIVNNGVTMPNPDRKALLQRINLTNVTQLAEAIDVSGSDKLREFRALGSQITYALFAEGAPLDTIHLPKTVSRIDLTEAKELKRILTSKPVVFEQPRDSYTGLYIEGLTDMNEETFSTAINRINIIGGNLGYDSYKLLENAVKIKDREATEGTRLRINMEEVNWSPYIAVEIGAPYDNTQTYYELTDHSTFVPYNFVNANDWMVKTLNQKIFTYDATKDETVIPSIALLDEFISDYETASVSIDKRSHYTNLQSTLGYPNITGSIYIANADGEAINEEKISQVYNVIWPKLNIYAANVNESYVAKFVSRQDSGADTEIDVKRFNQSTDVSLTLQNITSKIPTKTNHSFLGWALDPEGNNMVFDYVYNSSTGKWGLVNGAKAGSAEATFSQSNNIIILYAIFELEKYGLKFYDGDGSLLAEEGGLVTYINSVGETDLVTKLLPYGSYLELPKAIAYKDDSSLAREEVYILKGWATSAGGNIIKNIESKKVTSNMAFYPVFEVGDVHNNPVSESFFDTVPSNFVNTVSGFYNSGDPGVAIKLKEGYTLRGKVTLPKTINGVKVRSIARADNGRNGFSGNTNITGIFWEIGATPETYLESCLANCSNLAYVEIPESIYMIRTQAFINCYSLKNRDFSGAINLRDIQNSAFNSAFATVDGQRTVIIPSSVRQLGAIAFGYNESAITTFQIGEPGKPSQLESMPNDPFNWNWDPYRFVVYVTDTNPEKEPWKTLIARAGQANVELVLA